MMPGFGLRLQTAINKKGINKKTLATRIGVSGAVITQWCKEESKPSLDRFAQICTTLETTPSQLLYGKAERKEEDDEILKVIYKLRPAVRKALASFLNLI